MKKIRYSQKRAKKSLMIAGGLLLFFVLCLVVTLLMINRMADKSNLFMNPTTTQPQSVSAGGSEEFPAIPFGKHYGALTIEEAGIKELPIYFGDSDEILAKGIGHFAGSRFPGQIGNCVLSGHVETVFRYLEDLEVGTRVYLNTDYGSYVYEIDEIIVFDEKDVTLLLPSDGTEKLTLYTCYPFDNNGRTRTDRIGIVCKYISGEQWDLSD